MKNKFMHGMRPRRWTAGPSSNTQEKKGENRFQQMCFFHFARVRFDSTEQAENLGIARYLIRSTCARGHLHVFCCHVFTSGAVLEENGAKRLFM